MKRSIGNTSVVRYGFTVVELLVVIVVIAILASITIVAYNGIQKDAAESTVKADLSGAAKSLVIAKAKTGCPASASGLPKSSQTTYSNFSCSGQNFCIQANSNKQTSVPNYYVNQDGAVTQGECSASGSSVPAAPTGVTGSMSCTAYGGTYVSASGTISWNTLSSLDVPTYQLYDVSNVSPSTPAVKIAEFTNSASSSGTRTESFTSAQWGANNAQTVRIVVRAVNSGGASPDSSAITQYFPPYDC